MNPSSRNLVLANVATLAAALGVRLGPGLAAVAVLDPERDHRSVCAAADARTRPVQHRGFHQQWRRVPEGDAGKRSTANFFALH